jgi:protein-disulfide isomerase
LAVVGVAAGGAAATYAYLKGVLVRDYPALLGDTIAATKIALADLGFPIVKEKTDTGTAFIQSKTADGTTLTIYFDVVASAVPANGAMTRVTVSGRLHGR